MVNAKCSKKSNKSVFQAKRKTKSSGYFSKGSRKTCSRNKTISVKDQINESESENEDEDYGSGLDSEEIEAFDLNNDNDDEEADDLETVNLTKSMLNSKLKNQKDPDRPKRRYKHADRTKGQLCESKLRPVI